MLKSKRTSRVRETRMEVPMTRLCTPARKSRSMARAERENQGWRYREVRKDTEAVAGSYEKVSES